MNLFVRDLRYSLRTLRKNPAFAAISVVTLALGIGANAAIFTLVNTILVQPLPFPEPDRLVRIYDDLPGAAATNVGLSVPELEDLRERSGVFERVSAIWPVSTALSGGDRVERIEMLGTHPEYFELLGVKAALGRVYGHADWKPGFSDGVVISDGLWKREFGANPHIVGRRIRVDEDGYTIIGVLPAGFRHPGETLGGDVELWAAAGFLADPFPSPPLRGRRFIPAAMDRLKSSITLAQAQQQLDALTARLRQAYVNNYPARQRWSIRIVPVRSTLTGNVRPTLLVLLAAVTFLLLMVCSNIASLMIAPSSGRMREFAIQRALGASRQRLLSQVLTESVLISLMGGAAALAVLRFGQDWLLDLMPANLPRLAEVHADWRIVSFALLLSLVTGILFGLAPALYASHIDPNRDLKEGGRAAAGQSVRQNSFRAMLVVVEVGLSVVLLTGAGLLIRSFSAALQQSPGLDPVGLTVGQIWIPNPNDPRANRYLTHPQRAVLVRELLHRLQELPGASRVAVGLAQDVPFLNTVRNPAPFSFPDDPATLQEDHAAIFGSVSPDYFETMGTPIQEGRPFTTYDAETSGKVAIVNQSFARQFSLGRSLIGRRLRIGTSNFEIIGVVGNLHDRGLDVSPSPRIYASIFQSSNQALSVFVRARTDIGSLNELLTKTVHAIDPELPVFGVRTMSELMFVSMAQRRFSLFLMCAFALVALLLSALGIYGVMSFVVGQRIQEFGVRSALGAQPRDLLMLALRPGLILTGVGIAVGLAASAGVTRLMGSLLFGISPNDPLIFVVVPLVLIVVTLGACLVPATRATRVSPVEALRGG